MQTIQLDDYFIHIGSDTNFWEAFNAFVADEKYSRKVIVMDENTKRDCLPVLQKHVDPTGWPIIEIKSGEEHKTLETCQHIWSQMMELQLDRKTLVVNLGGGVIGDMSGFCAATYKRGLYFVQLPTTLLSQVDASIGGKLGIDFKTVKNTIGLFENPEAVFIAPEFLKTLPKAELKSGYSEVIKHALIGDALLWKDLQTLDINAEQINWSDIIHRSLLVKQSVVAQDPFERGLRKILNFGHTIGHALESHALDTPQPLLHGEAIAIGMICESWLAFALKKLSEADFMQIAKFLMPQTPQRKTPVEDLPQLLALMQQDKKNEGGVINFSIVPQPGEALFNITAPIPLISESLHRYNALLP
ncbi:MAG: 3-dehydroquinate synthase [Saprospiraceae bacterium]